MACFFTRVADMVYNVPAWRFFMAGVRFIDPVAGVCLWWFYSGLTAAFFVVVCVLGDIRFRLPQRLITIVCS